MLSTLYQHVCYVIMVGFFVVVRRTSVLFLSISFIVLMVVALAWLTFYYVQRFRYVHNKDRLSVSKPNIILCKRLLWKHQLMYHIRGMSRDQNAGRSHNMKMDSRAFQMVEEFKHLGATLTNQNYLQEEIKRSLKSGNACCHSMQNILSSSLLSKNLKIKLYRTINFACYFVWVWKLVADIEGGT